MTANGNGFWKLIGVTCMGVFLGWAASIFAMPKDIVQERELTQQVLILNNKIDAQSRQISALTSTVNQLTVDFAPVAAKMGVTAHPVIAPQ